MPLSDPRGGFAQPLAASVYFHPLCFRAQEWQQALLLLDRSMTLPPICTICKTGSLFLHLQTLISTYANVWGPDFCSFSAPVTTVCFNIGRNVIHLYLKVESVWAKNFANNYLLVVIWKTENLPVLSKLSLVLVFSSFTQWNTIFFILFCALAVYSHF